MRNILVTGGAGFIGSNFIQYLLNAEPEVRIVNIDALTYAGNQDNLKDLPGMDRHIFAHADICDRNIVEHLLYQNSIDTVVHFAAETHVDRSILCPETFIKTNIVGTLTLLEAVKKYWLAGKAHPLETVRFHHISTDEVYGSLSPDEESWTEDAPYAPNSPYAASKAGADHLVRSFGHTYGLPVTLTNCSNNYGPYQYPEKLIPVIILNALEGSPIPVYGDGGQVRDWLFVEDHCEAIHTVLSKGLPGETYNIGGDNQMTNLKLVQMVCDVLDTLKPDSVNIPHSNFIKFVEDRPGHDRRYSLNTTKIQTELGWHAGHSFDEGITNTVKWYLDNMEWVGAIRKRPDYKAWLYCNYEGRRI
ncbi:dTDP-glucose 4,6-dehydratase [Candidatus Latescibacterota bacterium]